MVGTFGCPDGDGPFSGVLALGGSEGGIPTAFLDTLVDNGLACLALAHHKGLIGTDLGDHVPTAMLELPLERLESGLRWLAGQPVVSTDEGRVGVVGMSKGGELALLLAATFPQLVGPVVAYTPSPTISERGMSVAPMYERGLDDRRAVASAAIPVERATGPILLVSGGDDRMWPAERMCRLVVERMSQHGRADDVRHLDYPDAGHLVFPFDVSAAQSAAPFPMGLGGTSEADAAADADARPQVIAHLRSATRSLP